MSSNLLWEELEDISCTVDISHMVDTFQTGEHGNTLSLKVIDNVRIPSFSVLEISAQVKGNGSHYYRGSHCYG